MTETIEVIILSQFRSTYFTNKGELIEIDNTDGNADGGEESLFNILVKGENKPNMVASLVNLIPRSPPLSKFKLNPLIITKKYDRAVSLLSYFPQSII
jgi:hypothetical protein